MDLFEPALKRSALDLWGLRSYQAFMANETTVREEGDEKSFEEILGRLESIAHNLESGEPKLEEALTLFEEGVRLTKEGTRRLDAAERKIEVLLDNGEVTSMSGPSSSEV